MQHYLNEKRDYSAEEYLKYFDFWEQQIDKINRFEFQVLNNKKVSPDTKGGMRSCDIVLNVKTQDFLQSVAPAPIGKFTICLSVISFFLSKYHNSSETVISTPPVKPVNGEDPELATDHVLFHQSFKEKNTIRDILRDTQSILESTYKYQDFPLQTLFKTVYDRWGGEATNVAIHCPAIHLAYRQSDDHDLIFQLDFDSDTFVINLTYRESLLPSEEAAKAFEHYLHATFESFTQIDAQVADVWPFRHSFNDQDSAVEVRDNFEESIIAVFKEQVSRYPENVALYDNGTVINYQELDQRSDVLAQYIVENFEQSIGGVIAVQIESSALLVVSMLSILKTGSAYLPIEKSYPIERNRLILKESGADLLITTSEFFADYHDSGVGMIAVDVELEFEATDIVYTPRDLDHESLAYLIFTSGSTGVPKGVMVEHHSVVNLVKKTNYADIAPQDNILQISNYAFDGAVFDIFGALLNGATLFVAPENVLFSVDKLAAYVEQHGINKIFITTALLNNIIKVKPALISAFDKIYFGGERVSISLIAKALQYRKRTDSLVHVYGPTEATTFSTYHPVLEIQDTEDTIPIGKSLTGTASYILDQDLLPCPVGAVGQIAISGEGVARGYHNDADLTQQKFVWVDQLGKRVYLTGDIGYCLPDGSIVFVGREDDQVKLRGNRIELAEIQSALMNREDINEAYVIIWEKSSTDRYIVAYYTGTEELQAEALSKSLKNALPEYMIPSYFIPMDTFPLNRNGKVEKDKLPAPEQENTLEGEVERSRNETDRLILDLLNRILSVDSENIKDNFFTLGGDSIKAIQFISELNEILEIELEVTHIFENPEVQSLSDFISERGVQTDRSQERSEALEALSDIKAQIIGQSGGNYSLPDEYEDLFPVSDIQMGMIYHGLINDHGSALYREQLAFEFEDHAFDPGLFRRAVRLMSDKHEILRTSFHLSDYAHQFQVVAPVGITELSVTYHDFTLPENAFDIADFLKQDRHQEFDHEKPGLWHIHIIKKNDKDYILLWIFHHAMLDGWSDASFLTELYQVYEQVKANPDTQLAPLASSYKDYIIDQMMVRSSEETQQYWLNKLAGYRKCSLPFMADQKEIQPENDVNTKVFELPSELSEQIGKAAKTLGCTEKQLFLLAFNHLIGLTTNEDDITVGLVTNGRPNVKDGEKILGCFLNTIPFRYTANRSKTFVEQVAELKEEMLQLKKHEKLSLREISRTLGERSAGDNLFFDIIFNYTDFHVLDQLDSDFKFRNSDIEIHDNTNTFLNFTIKHPPKSEDVQIAVAFKSGLYTAQEVETLITLYRNILNDIADTSQLYLSNDRILGEDHMAFIAGGRLKEPSDLEKITFVDLFERQVLKYPDATALISGDERLSYAQINARANQLAHLLEQKKGETPFVVGVAMSRNSNMLATLIGIMKAGAAFLPIAIDSPKERIDFVLEDSGAQLLITDQKISPSDFKGEVWHYTDLHQELSKVADNKPTSQVLSEQLAYLLYTSGSTGLPKAVEVSNANLVNFLRGFERLMEEKGYDSKDISFLALTTIIFDISLLELFWPLTKGGKVVLVEDSFHFFNESSADKMDFSLFYFGNEAPREEGRQKYELLIEGAKFADVHGFRNIWTPERHFNEFGGLYPNPSLTSSAIAMITNQIRIIAGSVVLPLHHVARIAEEWSFVDNISNGRAGISFASGWHVDDFVLNPDHYPDRHKRMYEGIEQFKKLWQGETVEFLNGDNKSVATRTYPQPVQSEIPIWVTAAHDVETFRSAGRIGANLLTHLLANDLDELEFKIDEYRKTRKQHGHDRGHVTLMVHTFIGEDEGYVKNKVREPFKNYLKSSIGLIRNFVSYADPNLNIDSLSLDDQEALIDNAFERYFNVAGLFGTPDSCTGFVNKLSALGVDELACLIDFGVDHQSVLDSLPHLAKVQKKFQLKHSSILDKERPNFIQSTPSTMKMLLKSDEFKEVLKKAEVVLVGGESFPSSLANEIADHSDAGVFNMYGPTETTIWSTARSVTGENHGSVGRPLVNQKVLILDQSGQVLPKNVLGEISIGGGSVAKGYKNNPELTREKFQEIEVGPSSKMSVFRTGDYGFINEEGELIFKGRRDQQVKIRGYRIELEEIEFQLSLHPEVEEVAVATRTDPDGNHFLCAYVVVDPSKNLDNQVLKDYLKKKLPEYMVPAVYVHLEALPLTANQKLDRKALTKIEILEGKKNGQLNKPVTALEKEVSELWIQCLGKQEIGLESNFFNNGGHSLSVIQLNSAYQRNFGIKLSLKQLFEHPTLKEQVVLIQELHGAATIDPISKTQPKPHYPVSHGQKRIWIGEQLNRDTRINNENEAFWFSNQLDTGLLEKALNIILQQHEIFRTVFKTVDQNPVQVILPYEPYAIEKIHWSDIQHHFDSLEHLIESRNERDFDLNSGPLYHFCLVKVDDDRIIFHMVLHHIIIDGWSKSIFFEQLLSTYLALSADQQLMLEEPVVTYKDYASWQIEAIQEAVLADYWKQRLSGSQPAPTFPLDAERPEQQVFDADLFMIRLERDLSENLRRWADKEGTTLFTVLLSVLNILLHKYETGKDMIVGTVVAGRNHPDLENIIGFFVNTLPLRCTVEPDESFQENLDRLKHQLIQDFEHQLYPFDKILSDSQIERSPDKNWGFNVGLEVDFDNKSTVYERYSQETEKLEIEKVNLPLKELICDIKFRFLVEPAGIRLEVLYNTVLYRKESIELIVDRMSNLISEVLASPKKPIAELELKASFETNEESFFNSELDF